jgi:hypothetical protein
MALALYARGAARNSGTQIEVGVHRLPVHSVKVKAKLSPCLTKHHAMKTYWRVEV